MTSAAPPPTHTHTHTHARTHVCVLKSNIQFDSLEHSILCYILSYLFIFNFSNKWKMKDATISCILFCRPCDLFFWQACPICGVITHRTIIWEIITVKVTYIITSMIFGYYRIWFRSSYKKLLPMKKNSKMLYKNVIIAEVCWNSWLNMKTKHPTCPTAYVKA